MQTSLVAPCTFDQGREAGAGGREGGREGGRAEGREGGREGEETVVQVGQYV